MNYQQIYSNLINRAINRDILGYSETHHIIPFRQGFELGIDPSVIGGRKNLRWILGEENRRKWDRFQPESVIKNILGE